MKPLTEEQLYVRIEAEKKYRHKKYKESKFKTFLKNSQQNKIDDLIEQSEKRSAKYEEKLEAIFDNLKSTHEKMEFIKRQMFKY